MSGKEMIEKLEKETKHTKGKWFNNGGRIYAQQGDDNIREICDVGLVNQQSKEDTANARLIVAAPDLLVACKALLANGTHLASAIELAKAAIAKAN